MLGQIVGLSQETIGLLTLLITVVGSGFAAYVGLKQRQLEAQLELARLAAAEAKAEAEKQGRKSRGRLRELDKKQDAQTKVLSETQNQIEKLEKNTNGMQERLLKEAAERGQREGHSKGAAEGVEKAKELAKEVAIEAVKQVVPQQVVVMNQADQPVPTVETK
jgi:uncharacterized protein HemX